MFPYYLYIKRLELLESSFHRLLTLLQMFLFFHGPGENANNMKFFRNIMVCLTFDEGPPDLFK